MIYETKYWYVCSDHMNTIIKREHLKWIEGGGGRIYEKSEKLWKIMKNNKN